MALSAAGGFVIACIGSTAFLYIATGLLLTHQRPSSLRRIWSPDRPSIAESDSQGRQRAFRKFQFQPAAF